MTREPSFATLLEKFFIQRLIHQRQASVHTIASYRDTFRLLLEFVQRRLHKAPSTLALEDINAPLVADFLDEQEQVRGVTARTRNLRLTAVHSFFRYAAFEMPSCRDPFAQQVSVDPMLLCQTGDRRAWSQRGLDQYALASLVIATASVAALTNYFQL